MIKAAKDSTVVYSVICSGIDSNFWISRFTTNSRWLNCFCNLLILILIRHNLPVIVTTPKAFKGRGKKQSFLAPLQWFGIFVRSIVQKKKKSIGSYRNKMNSFFYLQNVASIFNNFISPTLFDLHLKLLINWNAHRLTLHYFHYLFCIWNNFSIAKWIFLPYK